MSGPILALTISARDLRPCAVAAQRRPATQFGWMSPAVKTGSPNKTKVPCLARTAVKLAPYTHNAVNNPAEPTTIRLLCVEDNPDDVELMAIALERADPQRRYVLHRVDNAAGFTECAATGFRCHPVRLQHAPLLAVRRAADPGRAALRHAAGGRHARDRRGSRGARAALRGQGLPDQGQAGHAAADHRARDDRAAARAGAGAPGARARGRLPPPEKTLRAARGRTGTRAHPDFARVARPARADAHRHGDPPARGQAGPRSRGGADPHRHRHGDGPGSREAGQDPVVLAAPRTARPAGPRRCGAVGRAAHRRAGRACVRGDIAGDGA